MSTDLYSPSWYRVAELRPRLKSHAEVHRHTYRGHTWYVLQDRASRRMYRFNPAAWQLIGLLDGTRTVQQAWDLACHRLGDDAPTQDESMRLLGQLHGADLLQSEVPPDVDELLRRYHKQNRGKWWRNVRNPMSIKLPLFDPDALLRATAPMYRGLFSPVGFLFWAALVGAAGVAAVFHWSELTGNLSDRVLAPGNLLTMLLVFPVVKAIHEFGHACAVRAKGGEVHEMGVMFLVFLPIPYVDASAATAYRDKWQRFVVGGAGMMAELALASLAMFLWIAVEPGLVRAVCFNVMLIAGISTVLFNGNPLLRYDGYYMLADLIEIPNLGPRGQKYLGWLIDRHGFGARELQEPEATPGEKRWFVFYTITATIYRQFITFAIILFVAGEYFVIGVILALWAATSSILVPLGKGIAHVARGRQLRRHRRRAWLVSGVVLASLLGVVFLLPLPSWTRTEGVLWVPEQSVVRAGGDGFVARLDARPGETVGPGRRLVTMEDPLLVPEERLLQARLDELEARRRAMQVEDRVQVQILDEELTLTRGQLERVRQRLAGLEVASAASGRFVLANPDDLHARWLRKGEQIGFVAPESERVVRIVVPQDDVEMVMARTRAIEVKLTGAVAETLPATLKRAVPAASDELPSLALAETGGGPIPVDPRQTEHPRSLEPVFHFELGLPERAGTLHIGRRVHVRFDHGAETLAHQGWRAVRRLFLKRFTV